MSKSNGAILTVSKLKEEGFNPLAYRFMCLNSHYRKQLVFSRNVLKQNEDTLIKLKNKIKNIEDDNNYNEEDFKKYNSLFKQALENDLNTSNALTVLYDVIKSNISSNTKLKLIESFDKVLSLDLLKEQEIDKVLEDKINKLIDERNYYKKEKNYEKSDEIRKEIEELGVQIKDTREGTEIIWI